jgi:hypothetical protein
LFVTKNASNIPSLDIISIANPASPSVVANINLSAFGASISSVTVKEGIVAAVNVHRLGAGHPHQQAPGECREHTPPAGHGCLDTPAQAGPDGGRARRGTGRRLGHVTPFSAIAAPS